MDQCYYAVDPGAESVNVPRGTIDRALAFIDRLFNQHKLVRRGLIISTECLTWYLVLAFVANLATPGVPHGTIAAIVGSVLAAREISIAFYKWSRDRDALHDRNDSQG
jgi:hypothetical protein